MKIENNMVNMQVLELRNLLIDAAKVALLQAGIVDAKISAHYTLRQAHKIYGRATVDRWIKQKLVKKLQDGPSTPCRLARVELEAAAAASNRLAFFKHKEKERCE